MKRDIDTEIKQFIRSISDLWKQEPLDGDETVKIANKVLKELNSANGNGKQED